MSSVGKQSAAPDAVKNMVEITIDGKVVTAEEGSSLFNAVKWTGVELPAMCYHYSFSPFGSCGLCLVEVEGKKNNVRACTAKVVEGMVVSTGTEKMVEARKGAVEKHLTTHPLDCPVCDKDGQCELQDMAYDLEVYDIKDPKRKDIPEDTRSIVLDFNMERCILCCFYKKDKQKHVGAHGGETLYCEFCGDCLAVCPVGAIVSKFSKYTFKPWQLKKTETTCGFCSDGCTITLETNDRDIQVVTSELSYTSKFGYEVDPGEGHGGICVRGRFGFEYVMSSDRLSKPLAKGENGFQPIAWFSSLMEIGKRLNDIKSTYGPQSIAGLISGRCTNESVYLFQRLMRSVLNTNNIDTAARYGHMNSVHVLQKTLKIGKATVTAEQLALSDAILMVGSNLTETNPITALRPKASMTEFGGQLFVADTTKTKILNLATHPLHIALDSEADFIQALVKAVINKEAADPDFIETYPEAYAALKASVGPLSETALSEKTGLEWEKIEETAETLAKSKRGILLWGEGIIAKPDAVDHILRLIDLALLCGLLRKKGGGILPICEENNEQGAVDMGGVPEFLPGQLDYNSPSERDRFSNIWHTTLPTPGTDAPGLTLPEMIEAAHRGEIKALYLVGENPLGTLPASMKVREALEKVDLIICQDPFLTETGQMADYVLPSAVFAENEGTYTNTLGQVNRVVEAFDPRGEARPDWKVFTDLSKHLGHPMQYRSVEEIHNEIAKMIPGYYQSEAATPKPDAYLESEFIGHIAGRYTPSESRTPSETTRLSLEPVLYHSGKLTTRDQGLMKIYNKAVLLISEPDADALGGLITGDPVHIKSDLGQLETTVEISPDLPKGLVQFPLHFNDPPMKDLLKTEIDSRTKVITFKTGPVTLMRPASLDLRVVSKETTPETHENQEADAQGKEEKPS